MSFDGHILQAIAEAALRARHDLASCRALMSYVHGDFRM